MDIFDKYAQYAQRHGQLLAMGADPFAVRLDELLSPTEAEIDGRPTILAGTNNYLGLTFDPACIAAARGGAAALRHRHHRLAHRQRHLWRCTRSSRRALARFLGRKHVHDLHAPATRPISA